MTPTNCPVIRLPPVEMPDLSRGNCVGHVWDFDQADKALGEDHGMDRSGENDRRPAVANAKAICMSCPVKNECLEWALEGHEWGVLGGTTPHERKRMRRMR